MIKQLEYEDLDDLLALYEHLHRLDDPLPPRRAVEAVWQSILSAGGMHRVFGAYDGGKLVSSCALTVVPNLSRGCRPYALVENVVTNARFRRRGYGRAVLLHAVSQARKAGCYKVMLMTGRSDEIARFYGACGFSGDAKRGFVATLQHNY